VFNSKRSTLRNLMLQLLIGLQIIVNKVKNYCSANWLYIKISMKSRNALMGKSRGDVPGWVLVVLMTTALVTGIWSIAAPKLTMILRNSLDAMAGIK
jgi:hypothetical protein